MNLIKSDGIEGYFIEDIKEHLNKDDFKRFRKWLGGQTGAIVDGKFLVYKWDFDAFMKGEGVYD